MLKTVAKKYGFTTKWHMPADMEWGNIKTKNNAEYWSGLIGKFLKHIINKFTITSQKHE